MKHKNFPKTILVSEVISLLYEVEHKIDQARPALNALEYVVLMAELKSLIHKARSVKREVQEREDAEE